MLKKAFALVVLMFMITTVSAQLINVMELKKLADEEYAPGKMYFVSDLNPGKFKKIAVDNQSNIPLDANGAICHQKVVEVSGKTQHELFDIAKNWVTQNFSGTNSSIQLIDKDSYTIIAKGFVGNVAETHGWSDNNYVNLIPVVKIETKEGRARITVIQSHYSVHVDTNSGMFSDSRSKDVVWAVNECYPYNKADVHLRASSKAYLLANVCGKFYLHAIEEMLLKPSVSSTTNEDW